jgi:hypothetical protein
MSTPRPPESSIDVHPTRQQLDELDDLLRRMLELPVQAPESPADAAEEPPAAPAREPSPSAPPVSYVVVETDGRSEAAAPDAPAEAPAPEGRPEGDAEGWIPFRSSWQPSPQTWGPLAESWHQARGSRPAPEPVPAAAPPPPPAAVPLPPPAAAPPATIDPGASARSVGGPPAVTDPTAQTTAAPVPDEPRNQAALAPLVWFNRAFDVGLIPLGGTGRWLRGPAGRTALGIAGMVCLAAAAALALSGGILPWNR